MEEDAAAAAAAIQPEETKEKKKRKSVKKSKDGERRKSDQGEVQEEKLPPVVVGGQLKPEIEELMPTRDDDNSEKQSIEDLDDKIKCPSPAALLVQELMSPLNSPMDFDGPYIPPTAVEAGDVNALQELDERKIVELKEAFNLFDLDRDGTIDPADLKATFVSLGVEVSDVFVKKMLSESMDPMDFESFVMMYGIKTIEMDPEEVLLEALSKWDKERTGHISVDRMKHDLMSFGDKFSEEEAVAALDQVPFIKGTGEGFGCQGPLMFDYPTFCKQIAGFRKRRKQDPVFIH